MFSKQAIFIFKFCQFECSRDAVNVIDYNINDKLLIKNIGLCLIYVLFL